MKGLHPSPPFTSGEERKLVHISTPMAGNFSDTVSHLPGQGEGRMEREVSPIFVLCPQLSAETFDEGRLLSPDSA